MTGGSADPLSELRRSLAARFVLEHELGRGGSGTVFLARDLRLGRSVAIKVLHPDLARLLGPERFLHEIEIAARLSHRGIVPLFDSGEAGGLLFYVMPRIEGESLRDRILREGPLPLDLAVDIAGEVAEALGYAHTQGVLHRDVKPSNILLEGGHALLADFGASRALGAVDNLALTESGLTIGTPEYMSPEQGMADPRVDARSDQYALACVVYEMLAGEPPFPGPTPQAVLARHRQQPPPSLATVRPNLSPDVQAVVERALAKNPADRFPSTLAFAAALRRARDGRPVPTDGPRRTRRAALLLAVVALIVAIGALLSLPTRRALDSSLVLGFPLVAFGAEGTGADIGNQLPFVIGHALEHTEPLKWRDGWTYLDDRQRTDARRVTNAAMRAIARQNGAAYYLDGVIIGAGDSITVTLRLHATTSGDQLGQSSATRTAGASSVAQAALQAVVGLLPALLAPGRTPDPAALHALADRHPGAIAKWIQGEELYRRSKFAAALDRFRQAVAEDSALAVSALRGAEAADWLDDHDAAHALLRAAEDHLGLLPAKYAAFTRGLGAYLQGDADSALTQLGLALAADSGFTAAWMTMGEVYFHLLPHTALSPDSAARTAFLRARRTDPGFAPPLYHLATLALRRTAASEADSFMRAFRAFDPDSEWTVHNDLMLACARTGGAGAEWSRAAGEHPLEAVEAAGFLVSLPRYADCARRGFEAVLALPAPPRAAAWGAVLGLQSLLVAEGNDSAAGRVLDRGLELGLGAVHGLAALDAAGGAALGDRATETARMAGEGYPVMQALTLHVLGSWAAASGDSVRLLRIHGAARALAARTAEPFDRMVATALEARVALARGDSGQALGLLAELRPVGDRTAIQWGWANSLGAERLLEARLLLAAGRLQEALQAAGRLDHPVPIVYLLYRPASLTLRAEAADRLGQAELAAGYRARLAALRGVASVPAPQASVSPTRGGTS